MADVFVFASNLAGRHGAGSAKEAREKYGAIYGQGKGRQGNSYGIPTKDGRDGRDLRLPHQFLPLEEVAKYVKEFLDYAEQNWTDTFYVVAIGCGLAGLEPWQVGPLFSKAPKNVKLPEEFIPYAEGYKWWKENGPEVETNPSSPYAHKRR